MEKDSAGAIFEIRQPISSYVTKLLLRRSYKPIDCKAGRKKLARKLQADWLIAAIVRYAC